jgi:hypothetical protein
MVDKSYMMGSVPSGTGTTDQMLQIVKAINPSIDRCIHPWEMLQNKTLPTVSALT